MITNGYLDWALLKAGPSQKLNPGMNPVLGIFFHSAEGYAAGMMNVLANVSPPLEERVSWHLSNMKDGRLLQHYSLEARCWHATAANQNYIGMEHEGKAGEPLTELQIQNAVRVIQEVSALYGWLPERPLSPSDRQASLYEHREVIRFGGSATACPSGRIPWDEILRRLQVPEPDFTVNEARKWRGEKLLQQAVLNDYQVYESADGYAVDFWRNGEIRVSLPIASRPEWWSTLPEIPA